jgi:hypothetical protein
MENYTTKEINEHGDAYHYNSKRQFHRLDGPAVEYTTGTKAWFINDKYHRLDGPAVEWTTGERNWYLMDRFCKKSVHNRLVLFYVLEPRRIYINPTEED